MDYKARAARAYIATGSDASAHHIGKSFGVAVDVLLTIIQNNGAISTIVIANESFHIPVSDIDVAERIGVLVGMDLILDSRDEIQDQIANAGARLQPPILLHFDRDCLEQTLPQCVAFDFLIRRLENQVDQHGGVVLRWEHRGSAFMRIIDRQAKEATQMKVCPMRRSFDPDFINILNGNRPFLR